MDSTKNVEGEASAPVDESEVPGSPHTVDMAEDSDAESNRKEDGSQADGGKLSITDEMVTEAEAKATQEVPDFFKKMGVTKPVKLSGFNAFMKQEMTNRRDEDEHQNHFVFTSQKWTTLSQPEQAVYTLQAVKIHQQEMDAFRARSRAILVDLIKSKSSVSDFVAEQGADVQQIECTACGTGLGRTGRSRKRRTHPLLMVPVCVSCLDIYNSGEFVVSEEDGHEIFCRWCGDGGELKLCDTCNRSFCADCIKRNLGMKGAEDAAQEHWQCYVCDPTPLKALQDKVKSSKGRKRRRHSGNAERSTKLASTSMDIRDSLGVTSSSTAVTAATVSCPVAKPAAVRKIVDHDIALGREPIKIPCVNEVDDEKPPAFTYVPHDVETPSVRLCRDPHFLACCDCTDGCLDPNKCACIRLNGRPHASYSLDGKLLEQRTAIYECNPRCRCHAACANRVVGRGMQLPLEIFRCTPKEKGWGVRCRTMIRAGTFIACYHGELLREADTEERGKEKGDEYLFNLDAWAYELVDQRLEDEGLRKRHFESQSTPSSPSKAPKHGSADGEKDDDDDEGVTPQERRKRREEAIRDEVLNEVETSLIGIDAKWIGNIGRFFNHSCAPNMDKQTVFVKTHDVRHPCVAFFTNSDVPAFTELTYNYGYVKGSVEGKQMICRCGEPGCIERMY